MNNTATTVDVSTARQTFSSLLDRVFLQDEVFIIAKRNIPVAILKKVTDVPKKTAGHRELDMTLFGILKKGKKDAVALADELRTSAWRRT